MFEPKQGQIPGYTGHQRTVEEPDQYKQRAPAQKQIPGYAGYIPGVKSEVQFGQTYGMTSLASKANAFHKGRDEPADLKYTTMMKKEFIDHATVQHETVADIVGVNRGEPRYSRPIPPASVHAFFGCEDPQVNDPTAEPAADNTVADNGDQTADEAVAAFYGISAKPKGLMLGQPIPGYSGVNRRVEADNVFGMTYAEACKRAKDSLARIQQEKGETLKMTSTF